MNYRRIFGCTAIGVFLIASHSLAVAQRVSYCGQSAGGPYIKVEPAKKRMCFSNSGQSGPDYCERMGVNVLPLVRSSFGQISLSPTGQPLNFREYVGELNGKIQLVRIFAAHGGPSAPNVDTWWSDFYGSFITSGLPTHFVTNPNSQATSGEPLCAERDED